MLVHLVQLLQQALLVKSALTNVRVSQKKVTSRMLLEPHGAPAQSPVACNPLNQTWTNLCLEIIFLVVSWPRSTQFWIFGLQQHSESHFFSGQPAVVRCIALYFWQKILTTTKLGVILSCATSTKNKISQKCS